MTHDKGLWHAVMTKPGVIPMIASGIFYEGPRPPKNTRTSGRGMRYYDVEANWPRIRRHIKKPMTQIIMVENFNLFTWGRWRRRFKFGEVPSPHGDDWQDQIDRKGRRPAFWKYTKMGACHWLVNFNLELARLAEPDRKWRILTSPNHSTVWDGELLLFDLNFLAMGVSPKECFEMANKRGTELMPGETHPVGRAEHYKKEMTWRNKRRRKKSK